MKYFLSLAFLINSIFIFNLNAQNITLDEENLKETLCQRWGIEYILVNQMKIQQIPGAKDFDFIFNEQGSYEILSEDGEKSTGKWTFYPKEKYIQLEIKDTKTLKIVSLTKTKLIGVATPGENSPPMDLEIHFRPYKS